MSSFDWKKMVGAVAPGLATLAGGPFAGAAVKALADKLLGGSTGDFVEDEAKIAGLLAGGMTPELRARVIEADQALQTELVRAGVRKVEVAADVEKAYLADTADARKNHGSSVWVMRLAVFINVASYLAIGGVLWGCFAVLNSTTTITVDPGIAAMVGSLIGAAVQWLLANASQANSFAFGSSPGSRAMAEGLGAAVAAAPGSVAKRQG
jgi:hypothetical protein